VPFPTFDPTDKLHARLADLGKAAEKCAASVELKGSRTFQAARKRVAEKLESADLSAKIIAAVTELLLADV
jgi:hypothetical protein